MKKFKISYTALTTSPQREVRSITVIANDKSSATTKAQKAGDFHWSQIVETIEIK